AAGVTLALISAEAGVGAAQARSPVVMLALGAITLANAAAMWRSGRRANLPSGPAAGLRLRSATERVLRERRLEGDVPRARSGVTPRAQGSPPPTIPFPTVTGGSGPGERIWSHLIPPEPGLMPAKLVGPVQESAFDAALDLEVIATPALEPPPEESPVTRSTDPVAPWTQSLTMADSRGFAVPPMPEGFGGGGWLADEAMRATPPHLRAAPEAPGPIAPVGLGSIPSRAAGPPSCASCSSELEDPAAWHRCTHCRRPLCLACILETLKAQGRGWCLACASMEENVETHLIA
ncbi:MAG: hypothetical protein L3K19_02550, partial [Thermoplasmata archaeon]|nr:hypothetical protein [Thermoplasmata archaeon]